MKKQSLKKFFALFLTIVIVLGCTACGSGESDASGSKGNNGQSPSSAEDGEIPTLKFNLISITGEPRAKQAEVMEAINVILREKAGAQIEPVYVNFAEMQQQMNLLLTGGSDSLDFFTSFWYQPLANMVTNGQVVAIDELMAQHGQETAALFEGMEAVLDCGRVDGKLYGIPTVTAWAVSNTYLCIKEDSDAANIDWAKVHDLDSLTEVLLEMKKVNPDHYYIPGSTQSYWIPKGIDYLGDQNYLGVLVDPLNDTTVTNYYESEYFLNILKNVKIWADNGLISPDPMSNNTATEGCVKNGITHGTTGYHWNAREMAMEDNATNKYGKEVVATEIGPSYITTGNVTTNMWHISPFCKYPEKAMKVLNLLYTDPEVATLFCYGIEGLTYVKNADGSCDYMEGENNLSSGWEGGKSVSVLNSTILPTWKGEALDINEQMLNANKNAMQSKALGFTCDMDPVADEVAACVNVIAQYYLPLMNGVADIDEVLPVFQQELKNAGIDTIIAYKQKQLDEWLANK